MTVTGMTFPISSKICVMPTFLPMMAFFMFFLLSVIGCLAWSGLQPVRRLAT